MIRRLVLIISLTLGPLAQAAPPAQAPPPPVSLLDLVTQALQTGPAVLGGVASQKAAERSRIDALLGFAPRASWTFDNSRERLNVKRSSSSAYQVGISNFANYGNVLTINQPVFDPRIFAQLHGAHEGLKRARAELAATRQRAVFEVIQAYLLTLGAADSVAVARAEVAALAQQMAEIDIRSQRGLASRMDVDEVTSRLLQSRALLTNAIAALSEAFDSLEHRAAGPVLAIKPLAGPLPMPPPQPSDAQAWVLEAQARNPDIAALHAAAGEAWAIFEHQTAALSPRLDLNYTQSRQETGGSVYGGGSLTSERTVLLRLTVPLFNADGAGYPAMASMARAKAARFRTDEQKLEVAERVRIAYQEIMSNVARAGDVARATAAQDRVTQSKRLRFSAGVLRITEVLDSERDLSQVRRLLLSTRYNYLLNMMQLKRLAGDISETDATFLDSALDHKGNAIMRATDDPARPMVTR